MSWAQLKGIQDQNKQEAERQLREPPVACPIDGSLLDVNGQGVRNCPMGNYTWRG